MPEMNGYEATSHIRNPDSAVINKDVPIIAITAYAEGNILQECLNSGMNGYITKPIDRDILFETIETFYNN